MPIFFPVCECCGHEARSCRACETCGMQVCRSDRDRHGNCLHCSRDKAMMLQLPSFPQWYEGLEPAPESAPTKY